MTRLLRLACAAYWAFLTVLLLVPDPLALLGLKRTVTGAPERGPHFLFFLTLALLAYAARWTISRTKLLLLLLIYATAVELFQWFVPRRTVRWLDYLENLVGLFLGAAVYWMVARLLAPRRHSTSAGHE
jgi:hypothetical protein